MDWTKAAWIGRVTKFKEQNNKALTERLHVLKIAWVLGNGEVPQPWFSNQGGKKK